MRPAVLALVASALSGLACSSADSPSCHGDLVATFRFKGPLVYKGDPAIAPFEPVSVSALPDCTPDPFPAEPPPIRYPHLLPPFDAKLAAEPSTGAAALCRSNGIVYPGVRTGTSRYTVEAGADPAAPCASSLCAAALRVIVAGVVAVDAGGAPQAFHGVLVEVLTEERGACDACLPSVPEANPPVRACAARYALTGTLR